MEQYKLNHIEEIPLSSPYFRSKVERFLRANGLRPEDLDAYYTLQNTDGTILAGAGIRADVIKCVAVAPEARSEGLVAPLISHIVSQHGAGTLKVFTKPENRAVFESLGFHEIASAPEAILLENGRGLEQYCAYLRGFAAPGRCGVVVMNANPFTLGHLYLLQQALTQVDRLFVIPVREDVSAFPYTERLAMICSASDALLSEENYFLCSCPKNQFSSENTVQTDSLRQKIGFSQSLAKNNFLPSKVVVLEGSDYQISATTFPTYFLKDLSSASENQMRLDLDLFRRHIAPALGASVRFVGSEPADPLTARYNALMKELLPEVVEIPRLATTTGHPVSASTVRAALEAGSFRTAAALTPVSTWPYLLAHLAHRALLLELDTSLKPGLVGPDSNGAHTDMDHALMHRAIGALRPYWSRMAVCTSVPHLQMLGIEAERTMRSATDGVNTHRGAIFAIGLTLSALGRFLQLSENEHITHLSLAQNAQGKMDNSQIINILKKTARDMEDSGVQHRSGVKSAREMAEGGYEELFADWLPFYRQAMTAVPAETARQKTLLRIMSTLDDTCVIKRAGAQRAQEVKTEAAALLQNFTEEELKNLCSCYAAEGISPGGAADMLSLTIFIDSITN